MTNYDRLYRYLFKDIAVRGELVTLNDTYKAMLEHHDYPRPVKQLLAEMLVATSLLTATLKFEGEITVQLQGDGPVKLVVINGNNHQEMRGLARMRADVADNSTLKEMMGDGYVVITITPTDGERYQGVVGLEGETLSECLENYFHQSEQLPTRLFIRVAELDSPQPMVAGMLLQVMPAEDRDPEAFHHLSQLTETIKAEELAILKAQEVLHRLYHQEDVVLFEAQNVSFKCTCSHQRSGAALVALPPDELEELLVEQGKIDMHCDFCGKHYQFDSVDIEALRANGNTITTDTNNQQLH